MLDSFLGLEMTVLSLQKSIISYRLILRTHVLKLFIRTFGTAAQGSEIFDPSHNLSSSEADFLIRISTPMLRSPR